MANMSNFSLGKAYNFTVYPTILGTFNHVTVEGIVDHKAAAFYIDPYALHVNVFSTIPAGLCPNDPTQYYYLVVKHPNGQQTAIGLPWIDSGTIEENTTTDCYLKLIDVSPDKLELIKEMCSGNGFTIGSVQFK